MALHGRIALGGGADGLADRGGATNDKLKHFLAGFIITAVVTAAGAAIAAALTAAF